MGVLLESSKTEAMVLVLVALFVWFVQVKFSYWSRRHVPCLKPSFPFGNLSATLLGKKTLGVALREIYHEMKKQGVKYCGVYMFTRPIFMPLDPDLLKLIMTKEFGSFQDRGIYHDEEVDPLSAHLFSIEGQHWRNLRTKLSPTFTSGKMKMMFQTLVKCSKELGVILDRICDQDEAVDIKDIAARYTTDIIASCAFGLDCNSLKNPEVEFRKYGRKVFELDFYDGMKYMFGMMVPGVLRTFRVQVMKKDVSNFFMNVVKQIVSYREANKVDRKDMMSLLLKIKNNESLDDDKKLLEKDEAGLTFNQLASQCFIFFLGGFETSSTTMTFVLFEISQHQDIQDKLRQEIRQVLVKHSGKLTYEAIMEMTYMDKVINETLRKYPPIPFLNRIANEDWRVPGTDVVIEKGTAVFIPNYGIQMDEEYFPNPEDFDPERFTDENRTGWHPYCYLPFGEGPRNCIGMRFGLLQTKVGLSAFLKDHRFHLHQKTSLPISYDSNTIVLSHDSGIWLQTTRV